MADPASIFGDPANPPVVAPADPQNDTAFADLLGMIRNESGVPKYKSVPDALNALAHAQSFIEQLKNEKAEQDRKLAELQGSHSKQEELERTVAELLQKVNNPAKTNADGSMTPEQIAEMVTRSLSDAETAKAAKANQASVVASLKTAFGDKAEAKYVEAAEELGISVAELNTLAAKSPKAVLKALGVSGQAAQPTGIVPGQNALNSAGFQPKQESFIRKNATKLEVGATTSDLQQESINAKKMVDELHAEGFSVHDLTDPKVYFKLFK